MILKTVLAAGLVAAAVGFGTQAQAATPGPGFDPAMVQEAAFGCPPGWHPGPYGHRCFRNFHPHMRWHAWHRWHRW